jgi:2-(1,2-epoxy-1,2-dihydrophenyl)acetyl-CoA isomerase
MTSESDESDETVVYEAREGVAWITLNRPDRLNAVTAELSIALVEALRRAAGEDVRAVVLGGAGRGFCSGSDLRQNFGPTAVHPSDSLRRFRHPILLAMRDLGKPIVCAVNGPAAGIGCSIALAGDFTVAAESATFSLAQIKLGLIPDGGATWFLSRGLSRARALEFALLGESIGAREAFDAGLIARCVADGEFSAEVTALAARLAAGPTRAYALAKAALDRAPANDLAEQLELEARLQSEAAASADFAEGLAAFSDRRQPRFEGA